MRLGTISFGVSLKNQIFSRQSSFSKLYFDYCFEIFGGGFFFVWRKGKFYHSILMWKIWTFCVFVILFLKLYLLHKLGCSDFAIYYQVCYRFFHIAKFIIYLYYHSQNFLSFIICHFNIARSVFHSIISSFKNFEPKSYEVVLTI